MDSMDMDNSGSLFAVLMAFKVQPRSRGLVRGEHAMIVINKFARKWQERKRGNGKRAVTLLTLKMIAYAILCVWEGYIHRKM